MPPLRAREGARIPDSLPFAVAAALPTAGITAYQAIQAAGLDFGRGCCPKPLSTTERRPCRPPRPTSTTTKRIAIR
jgi:hypothetical protein